MQTTLLGFAIAIILALIAALVGPLFIDWGRYRGEFEARASKLTGLEVRIKGPIDARLLPTPTLTLQRVEVNRPGDSGKARARTLRIEFALGALVRGEWRANEVRIEKPEFALALDGSGRLDWPMPAIAFDPDSVSIQRIEIEDGRAILADAGSGSHIVLEKLGFTGEARSLLGPFKGEGSFHLNGQHYPYRVSANRLGDDGTMRVRFGVDPIDRPFTADAEATVWIDQGMPRYEGTLQIARPVTRAQRGDRRAILEPWRITSRIRGDGTAAVLEQVEFQYGPDDRPVKLRGDARLTFGSKPQLDGVLSAQQIDLDRMLALPEPARKRPLAAIKAFVEYFATAQRLPLPVKLGIGVETLTLAGSVLHRVRADVKTDAETWDIQSIEFRAPGLTQIGFSGRVSVTPKGVMFGGPAKIDSSDPRMLIAWLADRTDPTGVSAGPLRVTADITLGSDTIAFERVKAEIDRITLEGKLAYAWATAERPARLDAQLRSPQIDLDRATALAKAILGDTAFDMPKEGALSLAIGRATIAGVEAKRADVQMQLDANGLVIRRIAVGDFGGASLEISGRIDTREVLPRGTVNLALGANGLDGLAAVIEKLNPQWAARLRDNAQKFAPVKLRATLTLDGALATAEGANAAARFTIDGRAGVFQINLQGDAGVANKAVATAELAKLIDSNLNLTGRLDSADASALVALIGLEPLVVVDKKPGRLTLAAKGPLDGELAVDSRLTAGMLDASAKGTVRLDGIGLKSAGVQFKVVNANLRALTQSSTSKQAQVWPAALSGRLVWSDNIIGLSDLTGTIAGTTISGRLGIGLSEVLKVDGELALSSLHLPAAIVPAIGMPVADSASKALWPIEPFEKGILGHVIGHVAVKLANVTLTPALSARDVRGVLRADQSEIAFDEIDGTLADGKLTGSLIVNRGPDGLAARTTIKLVKADASQLVVVAPRAPLVGRMSLDLSVEGAGRSPVALIGSLGGSGRFALEDGVIVGLNPTVFDAVVRAVDQGLPIDTERVRNRVDPTLAAGKLSIASAEGTIIVTAGAARLENASVRARGAELTVNGSVNLATAALDARLKLVGEARDDAPAGTRPEVLLHLKGPLDAPQRTIDVASLSSWLALRAVEQQARRLEQLQSEPAVAPGEPRAAAPPTATPVATPPVAALPAAPASPTMTDAPPREPPVEKNPPAASPPLLPPAIEINPSPRSMIGLPTVGSAELRPWTPTWLPPAIDRNTISGVSIRPQY